MYLSALDWFVKSILKAKYYIRYVDDFIILDADNQRLEFYRDCINGFLRSNLWIQLYPDKSRILRLGNRFSFLGFRVFYYHKLLKKSNLRKMAATLDSLKVGYHCGKVDYDDICNIFEGWIAYAKKANTFKLRKKMVAEFEAEYPNEISITEINRYLKSRYLFQYS